MYGCTECLTGKGNEFTLLVEWCGGTKCRRDWLSRLGVILALSVGPRGSVLHRLRLDHQANAARKPWEDWSGGV